MVPKTRCSFSLRPEVSERFAFSNAHPTRGGDGLRAFGSRIEDMNSLARGLRLFLIGIVSASTLFAGESGRDQENDKTRLRELKEVLWPKAYREQDPALLAQILADEFESIDAGGNRSTKTEELDYVRKNKPSYDWFRFVIRRLQIFENRTAVVSGTGYIETKPKEGKKGSKAEYQSSNVFIERDGRWQAISSHVSGIKQSES
jgi:Domain of unknown function (DUF4440)